LLAQSGPSGRGFGDGLTTRHCKNRICKEPKLKLIPRDRVLDKTQWKRSELQGFRICTCNVKTLYKAETLDALVDAIDKIKYKVNTYSSVTRNEMAR